MTQRVHPALAERRADAADLLEWTVAAAGYLVRAVGPDGKLDYSFDAATGQTARRYNILRHAGAIHALCETHAVTGETVLAEAAARALRFLDTRMERTGAGRLRVVERQVAKVGGNALAALAYGWACAVADRAHAHERLSGLLSWVVDALDGRDAFSFHKWDVATETATPFVSEYYPGEAAFALARAAEATGETTWLDAATRIARRRITDQAAMAAPPHDHWLLYAIEHLDRLEPAAVWFDHAAFLADAIIETQHDHEAPPMWRGGFDTPPRSAPTATRLEALVSVARIARRHRALDLESRTMASLATGAGFLRRCQLARSTASHPATTMQRDLHGAVVRSLTSNEIRIDYVQHAISAWLGYRDLLLTADQNPNQPCT